MLESTGYWAYFQRSQDTDWSAATSLQLHMVNPGPTVSLKVAIGTGDGYTWHESAAKLIPTGASLLDFGFTDDWDTPIANLDQVRY